MRSMLALGLVLLAVPTAGAEGLEMSASTPTTLYLHVDDGMEDIPMNTQAPPAGFRRIGSHGAATNTLTCLDGPTLGAGSGVTGQNFATSYAYLTLWPVEYDDLDAAGRPRTHPERGLGYDALIDPAVAPNFTWYLALGAEGGGAAPPPMPVPNLQMRVTARASDRLTIDDSGYEEGALLLQGTTPPATVAGDQVIPGPAGAAGVKALGQVDGAWVYELTATLERHQAVIPRATGMNVRIDLYSDIDACDPDDGLLLPASQARFTADGVRPRLELAVMNPLRIEDLHPQFVGDDLVLHTAVNSVWGNYDLDLQNLTLQLNVSGPNGFVQQAPVRRTFEHGAGAYSSVDVTWVWENGTKALDGGLEGTITVLNKAGTAVHTASFKFEAQPAKESPTPLAVWLLVGLLALALRRR